MTQRLTIIFFPMVEGHRPHTLPNSCVSPQSRSLPTTLQPEVPPTFPPPHQLRGVLLSKRPPIHSPLDTFAAMLCFFSSSQAGGSPIVTINLLFLELVFYFGVCFRLLIIACFVFSPDHSNYFDPAGGGCSGGGCGQCRVPGSLFGLTRPFFSTKNNSLFSFLPTKKVPPLPES